MSIIKTWQIHCAAKLNHLIQLQNEWTRDAPWQILKQECLSHQPVRTLQQAYVLLEKIIFLYNYKRPHLSCNMLSPNEAYSEFGPLEHRWKNYYNPSKRKEKK